jgi:hypothetical protein
MWPGSGLRRPEGLANKDGGRATWEVPRQEVPNRWTEPAESEGTWEEVGRISAPVPCIPDGGHNQPARALPSPPGLWALSEVCARSGCPAAGSTFLAA